MQAFWVAEAGRLLTIDAFLEMAMEEGVGLVELPSWPTVNF